MGTNFYVRIPIKSRSKCLELVNDIKAKLEADKADKYDIQDFCYELQKKFTNNYIHLGKRSCGWSFCWDLNKMKYYEPTLESIKKFIEDNNAVIVDEYGEEFTWDQFINDEIGWCLHPQPKYKEKNDDGKMVECVYYTHKTYHYDHPEERIYFSHDQEPKGWDLEKYANNGVVDYDYDELITKENLRFVLYTDFS